MTQTTRTLAPTALQLGYAGLLPQAFAVFLILDGSDMRWIASAGGFGYAAIIFSFLGGLWWAMAMLNPAAPRWIYAAAVTPSLIALLTFLPWTWGWEWPGPSLMVLAFGLMISPLIDRQIVRHIDLPDGWMRLRWHLSLALGGMTAFLAVAALGEA